MRTLVPQYKGGLRNVKKVLHVGGRGRGGKPACGIHRVIQ